nr:hypothetical protein [Tanacetum cinerariifolium]
ETYDLVEATQISILLHQTGLAAEVQENFAKDDSGTRLERESHKQNPKVVDDDVNKTEEKKYDKKDDEEKK